MATNRMQKFDELILRELSKEINYRFPDKIVTITQVHVSKDLSFAKVWISSYMGAEEIVKELRDIRTDLRHHLSKVTVARRVPSLYFVPDLTEDKAQKIDRLLDQIK
jgi:ribosome-binding factor A